MTIHISDTSSGNGSVVISELGTPHALIVNHSEQRQLLEALARVHGFSLVDKEERRSLLELASEADDDDNDYGSASEAWTVWQDRCEALSSAVTQALLETPKNEEA